MDISATGATNCIVQPFKAIGSAVAKLFKGIANAVGLSRAVKEQRSDPQANTGGLLCSPLVDVRNLQHNAVPDGRNVTRTPGVQIPGPPASTQRSASHSVLGPTTAVGSRLKHAAPNVGHPPVAQSKVNPADAINGNDTERMSVIEDLRSLESDLEKALDRPPLNYGIRPSELNKRLIEQQSEISQDIRSTRCRLDREEPGSAANVLACSRLDDILATKGLDKNPNRVMIEETLRRCIERLRPSGQPDSLPPQVPSYDTSTPRTDVYDKTAADLRRLEDALPLTCQDPKKAKLRSARIAMQNLLRYGNDSVRANTEYTTAKTLLREVLISGHTGAIFNADIKRALENLDRHPFPA